MSLIIQYGAGKGIDGRQLTIAGIERNRYADVDYACAGCGHAHNRHWADREKYALPPELAQSDMSILFDRCRWLAAGCDDCECKGLC